jgi:hypothetical protein
MTNVEGLHGNAQNQVSASANDISKLAEKIAEGLAEASLDGFFKALEKIQAIQLKNQQQTAAVLSDFAATENLADRKENLTKLKHKLAHETSEFRRDSRRNAVKVGLGYILSLFKNVKKFLQDTWEAPGRFIRGIKNKFKSLKDFMFQETKGEVNIGQQLTGSKQEQAEKFIKLLNISPGEKAPEGLENTTIAPWGENLITVDENNNVTANLIQPLMKSEVVQLAIERNTVAAAMAANIQPVPSSLASQELNLQGQLIGQDTIDELLKNIQEPQLSKSIIQELEKPSQIPLEAPAAPIDSVEADIPAVLTDLEELIPDPFNEPETQPVVITQTQLEDLSNDLNDDVSESLDSTEVAQKSPLPQPNVPLVNKLSSDKTQAPISPPIDFVAIVITPKLANDLVTIAQLHQIGTLSDASSLPLLQSAEDKVPLLITQTAHANGSASYQVVDVEKEFNFTVTPEQIVTNFNIRRGDNSAQMRKLVTSIANVVKAPEQTEFKLHPDSDFQRIETVQQLNGLLDRTATQTDRTTRSVVTLDKERFGMKIDIENRKVVITDKTTSETVSFGKNGIEDGGLLKKMTEVAKDKSSSLAQRLARVVAEKTNEAKTVLENAPANIMATLDERATVDRATARKVSKAVNRLGSQVDSFIGQGIRNVVAANPAMSGIVRQMKKIEQVGDATENQVNEDLQSAGEHFADSSLVRDGEAQLEPSSIDDREEFQRRLSEAVVHKSPAKTSGQAMQQSC